MSFNTTAQRGQVVFIVTRYDRINNSDENVVRVCSNEGEARAYAEWSLEFYRKQGITRFSFVVNAYPIA